MRLRFLKKTEAKSRNYRTKIQRNGILLIFPCSRGITCANFTAQSRASLRDWSDENEYFRDQYVLLWYLRKTVLLNVLYLTARLYPRCNYNILALLVSVDPFRKISLRNSLVRLSTGVSFVQIFCQYIICLF